MVYSTGKFFQTTYHYIIHGSSVFIVKSVHFTHYITVLNIIENKRKRIMPLKAENIKSEVGRWESKVSPEICIYFVKLAKIVLSHAM
jgi:hypothetical protein